jgi:hypothetical protein
MRSCFETVVAGFSVCSKAILMVYQNMQLHRRKNALARSATLCPTVSTWSDDGVW